MMSSPVRLSRSRRILSRSGSRSSIRSNSPSSPSSSSSKFATPRASVDNDPDDSPNPRPSPGVRRSPSPSRSRCSRESANSASRRRSTSDGAPGDVQEIRQASPTRLRLCPPKQSRFGIPAPTNQPRIIGNFDFEEKYPEDPIYEELGPNARAWRANLDECEVFDNDMVTEARDGLDLMLVFAGLFSAVLTTFVAQTSQALSNNFPAVSTALLLEMVTLQRAFINGSSINNISASEMSSGPSGFDIWVNALWFTSLTLSLGTALMAVLVKQWLYQYMSIISGTARDRSLLRFYRFDGLRKWHVLTIIFVLPIVLHIALGLFLAGLVVFLIPLNTPLAIVIGFITLVIYNMYAISSILPILYAQCPYRTPFSDILNVMLHPLLAFLLRAGTSRPFRGVAFLVRTLLSSVTVAIAIVKHFSHSFRTWVTSKMTSVATLVRKFVLKLYHKFVFKFAPRFALKIVRNPDPNFFSPSTTIPSSKKLFKALKEAERIAATSDDVAEEVASDALMWLYRMTSNPPTKSVVLQSIGCLSDKVSERLTAISPDMEDALGEIQHPVNGAVDVWTIIPGQETRAEKLLRSDRHSHHDRGKFWLLEKGTCKHHFQLPLSILTHPRATIQFTLGGSWVCKDFLIHIVQYDIDSILFPSMLWKRLFGAYPAYSPHEVNLDFSFKLCQLALRSLDNDIQAEKPFSGGVPITHRTVTGPLLQLLLRVLPPMHGPNVTSEPLRQLFTMNDFIVDALVFPGISCLCDIWCRIERLQCHLQVPPEAYDQHIPPRVETLNAQVFVDGWFRVPDLSPNMISTYVAVIIRVCSHNSIASPEFFERLLVDLCSMSQAPYDVTSKSMDNISSILRILLDEVRNPAYFILFCQSPLFSPGITVPLYNCLAFLRPIFVGFVSGLARGDPFSKVTFHCMNYLCAEPDRLFTVCRILVLEDTMEDPLVKFASIAPTYAAWKARARYTSADPQNWRYLRLTEDDALAHLPWVKKRMSVALGVLDGFFASLEIPYQDPAPPEAQPTSIPNQTWLASIQHQAVQSALRVFIPNSPRLDFITTSILPVEVS